MIILSDGKTACKGLAMGKAFVFHKPELCADTFLINEDQVAGEIQKYENAIREAISQLVASPISQDLSRAHISLIRDAAFSESVIRNIRDRHQNVQLALTNTTTEYCTLFEQLEEETFRERSADIRDISSRLMLSLKGVRQTGFEAMRGPAIIIAKELTPSDTSCMNKDFALGFVTETGGVTSHVSMIARNWGIPALVGVKGLMENIQDGDDLILDGYKGKVIINPEEKTLMEYESLREVYVKRERMLQEQNNLPVTTLDGRSVKLYAIAGNLEDIRKAVSYPIEGIGLFRSEALFMEHSYLPTEEEQFQRYKEAALLCKNNLVIRTLDIGGDKFLPYYPLEKESNPFLGLRGIRISLERIAIFKSQLRAILRASVYGNVKVMYPMITSLEELEKANSILEECKLELKAEGIPFQQAIKVGIMMETPAAALCADILAKHVDFFSIGTNDLTQYTLAVDRGNEKLSSLFDPYHPALVRSYKMIIDAAHAQGIEVGMCGGLAGDESATLLLLGLGLDAFCMAIGEIAAIRNTIRNLTYEKARELAERAVNAGTSDQIKELLTIDFDR